MAFRYVKNRSEIWIGAISIPPMAEFCHFHTPDYVVEQNIDKSKYFSIYTSQMSEIVYLGINL